MFKAFALASALLFAGTAEAYWQVPPSPQPDRLLPVLEGGPGCFILEPLRHGTAGAP